MMRKLYSIVLFVSCFATLNAQYDVKTSPLRTVLTRENYSGKSPERVSSPLAGCMRETVFSEDFEAVEGPYPGDLPTGWTTTEVAAANSALTNAFQIHNSTTANAGNYWPVAETGNGNLFAGANDDAPPCDCDMVSVYLTSPVFDLSQTSNPAISFDIYNDGNFGGDAAFIEISVNATSWDLLPYPLEANGNLPVEDGIWQNIVLTLYDYVGQPEVQIRFGWGDNTQWASGFGVDNVIVGDIAENSLASIKTKMGNWNQPTFGLGFWEYTEIPLSQVSPLKATTIVYNTGLNDQYDVMANLQIERDGILESGTWQSAAADTLGTLLKDTLSIVTDYVPSQLGTYSLIGSVSSAGEDPDTSDNQSIATFEITNCTYARDLGAAQAYQLRGDGDIVGNLFDIYEEQEFSSIQFAVGTQSTINNYVSGIVFEFGGFDQMGLPIFTYVDGSETDLLTIEASMIDSVGEGAMQCLPFSNGTLNLLAGRTYLVGIVTPNNFRIPVSGSNVWAASWTRAPDANNAIAWGTSAGIPMVRLLGSCNENCANIAVRESDNDGFGLDQNIPNPATIETRINYTLPQAGSVNIEVFDIAGQLVERYNLGSKGAGNYTYNMNVSGFAPGVYVYTMKMAGREFSRKMIIH